MRPQPHREFRFPHGGLEHVLIADIRQRVVDDQPGIFAGHVVGDLQLIIELRAHLHIQALLRPVRTASGCDELLRIERFRRDDNRVRIVVGDFIVRSAVVVQVVNILRAAGGQVVFVQIVAHHIGIVAHRAGLCVPIDLYVNRNGRGRIRFPIFLQRLRRKGEDQRRPAGIVVIFDDLRPEFVQISEQLPAKRDVRIAQLRGQQVNDAQVFILLDLRFQQRARQIEDEVKFASDSIISRSAVSAGGLLNAQLPRYRAAFCSGRRQRDRNTSDFRWRPSAS